MAKVPAASTPPPASRTVTVPGPTGRTAARSSRSAAPAKPGTRAVTVPSAADFQHAEKDALLQLRIGRSAHLYAVIASAALALDAVLLLFFYPHLPSLGAGDHGSLAVERTFFLVLPLLGGLALSVVGLASKWEAFQLWPWEAHFSTTVGAVAVNTLLALVYGLRVGGVGPFAAIPLYPWFYPAELAGITLALVGIVLTWSGWSGRQWASALSALLAVGSAALLVVPPPGASGDADVLAVSLFISAILYQTSGSFLHLISSGTRPHERELITSGQSRMFRLADELKQRDDAIRFRETALVQREAQVENAFLSVRRQHDSLEEARHQLDDLEEDYRKRSDALALQEQSWAGRIAESDTKSRLNDDKSKALELREQEVARQIPHLSAREQRLVAREGEQTKRDVELTQRQQALDQRDQGVKEAEARLASRRQELDQRTQELLRKEGDVTARTLSPGGADAVAAAGGGRATEADPAREARLRQLQAALDEQNVQLGKRARELAERAKTVEAALQRSAEQQADIATREANLRQGESELADLKKSAGERQTRYDSAVKEYEGRLEEVGRQSSEAARKAADAEQRLKTVTEREGLLASRGERLRTLASQLDRREGELTAREAALVAAEDEVGLRRQAAARSAASSGPRASSSTVAGAAGGPGRERAVATAPSGGIRDIATEGADPGKEAAAGDMLAPPTGRRFGDRLPTGTARLDDLLLGGIPPRGHIVLLGDAFVGKEVVLYGFVAEGLKRGEPVILVTAARSPAEVAQSLGVVQPQFLEYEQMGLVHWIDASGSGARPDGHHVVLQSSDDRAGILSNLVKVAKELGGEGAPPVRVGFLGLAAVLAHGDERVGFSFLQNVVGILKPRDALAMYSLESGALSEAQVETLLSRMDGAILFRQDRDRLFLSVKGFGEVETREWIECRATPRGLVVGSFALERIR